LCHLFLLLIWRGENSLKRNAERQRQEGLHIKMRLTATNSADLARCHGLKIGWVTISIIDYTKERVGGRCVRIRGIGGAVRHVGVSWDFCNTESVRLLTPLLTEGVSAALEVVGTPTLPDTLAAVRVHGTVCFTGMLSDQWTVRDFYPIGYLPNGVRLTAYSGDAADLPAAVLQSYLDRIASGEISLGPVHVYSLDDIQVAHTDLEEGRKVGKLVGRTTGR